MEKKEETFRSKDIRRSRLAATNVKRPVGEEVYERCGRNNEGRSNRSCRGSHMVGKTQKNKIFFLQKRSPATLDHKCKGGHEGKLDITDARNWTNLGPKKTIRWRLTGLVKNGIEHRKGQP